MENKDKPRTGIERFYEKYHDYPRPDDRTEEEVLGIGAMMIDPTENARHIKYSTLY